MGILAGKNGLIVGVANERSAAWGIAKAAHQHGANLAFSYQMDAFKKRLEPLAGEVGSDILLPCDLAEDGAADRLIAALGQHWNRLDFVVHAVGFSDKAELKGPYFNTSRANFEQTLLISAFSLTELTRAAVPMMTGGGAVLTLSYLGGVRTTPNYNVMGVAKAALEASVRYLAVDLGGRNIRVNTLSAGPMKTLAGAAISGARHVFRHSEEQAPLGRNPDIDEVGKAAVYLVSDLSSGVTGETHYADGGYHHIGVPNEG
ncbi:MAG: enoyl-ACP reductase [Alphaproteobacteria bacterium]|jgi:enoyl-[acyl-carrier protein] reductase I|nr:enoyl-ACP reductase [Alphaproteobacteria bacterium]